MEPAAPEILNLKGVSKRYGDFYAIQEVDLAVRGGEVHVLFGENGAGKSTVIRVVSGVINPDAGEVEIAGVRMKVFSPQQARQLGVSCVFQEFSLAPELTVEENLFLGREERRLIFLSVTTMRRQARNLIAELGFALPLNAKIKNLSRAQQQMVEIAKALLQDIKILILDEPTASLTAIETRSLFMLLEALKARGVAIIYVSHRMKEIRKIADRITVLRNGRKVATVAASDVDEDRLIELMIGRRLDALFPTIDYRPGEIVLEIAGLSTEDGRLRDTSLIVRAGEIVGLAGLIGSGNSDLLRAIYGLNGAITGKLSIYGRPVNAPTPVKQLRDGVCYFPSDRVGEGLALSRSVRENVTVTLLGEDGFARWGFFRFDQITTASARALKELDIRLADDRVPVGSLSGGNRQKVMLARGVVRNTCVYLFDEPTVGIDVSAKAKIYEYIKLVVENGGAVLLVSSELLEMTSLAHRIYVMSEGRIVSELQEDEISEETVLNGFFNTTSPDQGDGPMAATMLARWRGRAARHIAEWLLPICVVVLVLFFGIYEQRFWSPANLTNILRNSSYLSIISLGQMLVLLIGGFDLSVGAVVALASVSAASVMREMVSVAPAAPGLAVSIGVLAGLLCGALVGAVNGIAVVLLKVPALMITLGTMSIVTGIALYLTRGIPVYGMPDWFVVDFGRRMQFLGIPIVVYVASVIIVLQWLLLTRTQMGRHLCALGSNVEAARLSGVGISANIAWAHVLCSLLAAATGVLFTARVGSGEATLGSNLTLESIAAAVIGGVSLRGGVGKVSHVVLGAGLLTVLANGTNLMRIDSKVQTVLTGIVLILAVALDRINGNENKG